MNTNSQARDSNASAQTSVGNSSGVYIPPHLSNNYTGSLRNGASGESRYSKDQMLGIYKSQKDAELLDHNLEQIFSGGWNPFIPATPSTASWGKKDETKDASTGPEVCWDHETRSDPLGLLEMSEDEKEVRTPPQNHRDLSADSI